MPAYPRIPALHTGSLWIYDRDIVVGFKHLLQRLSQVHMTTPSMGGQNQDGGLRHIHHFFFTHDQLISSVFLNSSCSWRSSCGSGSVLSVSATLLRWRTPRISRATRISPARAAIRKRVIKIAHFVLLLK